MRHRISITAIIGILIILACAGGAVLAPWIAPYDPNLPLGSRWEPPSAQYWLGLDQIGRDMLSRILYGGRISIGLALLATVLAFVVGIITGFAAAVFGGWVDVALSRIADVILSIPILFGVALISFLLVYLAPGDPLGRFLTPNVRPEVLEKLREIYGLDKPLYEQFWIFLTKAVRGDFGQSFVYKTRTVTEIMRETFPISLFLGAMALAIAVAGGITLGILAAVYQNRAWDYVCVSLATLGVSLPNFVLAVFLIVLFSFVIPLFPTGGWGSWKQWVLPTVTLSLAPMGIVARFTRSSMLEVIRSEYVKTARAKGLAERPIVLKHVLKNALIPVVTLLGPMFAAVGTGSFFVFALVGLLGYNFLEASAKAKLANWATNLAALVIFVPQGAVIWQLALPMAAANITGGYLGARLAVARGAGFVRVFFLVVVSAFVVRLGGGLLGWW